MSEQEFISEFIRQGFGVLVFLSTLVIVGVFFHMRTEKKIRERQKPHDMLNRYRSDTWDALNTPDDPEEDDR